MMRVTERGSGQRIYQRVALTGPSVKRGVRQGMFFVARALRAEAQREIKHGRKTGRIYLVRKRGRVVRHQSSAPFETHANLSGRLLRSISFQLRGTKDLSFGYGISAGNDAPEYAAWVEFGTSKLAPRPSLKNALDAESGNIVGHFEREIGRALR